MHVGILGPLVVRDDAGVALDIAGARLRALLVRLALGQGRPVSNAALSEAVWGATPPADAANALQTLVSRLRRALHDPALIEQSPAGYRLAVDPDHIDVARFEHLARTGGRALRTGDLATAAAELHEACALWRGSADVPAQLTELRLGARLDLASVALRNGEADRAIAELDALHDEHPLDERIATQLVTALAAAGRQADALRAYERIRGALADDLGVDPSADLQAAHLAVLRGEIEAGESRGPRRTNLRAQLTSFVGRDEELARVTKALDENRLVTIVGPGGAGKTRLASEAGATLTLRDGVWMAELAGVTEGADIASAVLGALGLREKHLLDRRGTRAVADAETRLVDVLADKFAVLVLDNCEHLIDASAALAEHLLGLCPHLRVLATSREPLGLIGEVVLAVPPLAQPPAGADVTPAMQFPAVRLFADRAAAARPDFTIDAGSVGSVIEIVRRLDGLPLAIELAAARLRTMPIADIADRLSDRFRLLTGGSRTALPRHRTLRAVVAWSWDLLTEPERLLAERVSVFPAGLTPASAAAVCGGDALDEHEIADVLASLLDKSLLQRVGDGDRLRMLETIREYGSERLAERGELEAVRARHAQHFGALVSDAQPHLLSADQLPWFDRLADERDNILAALRFRCDTADSEGALAIAVGLSAHAMMLGNHDLGSWLADALAVSGSSDSDLYWIATALAAMDAASNPTGSPASGEPDGDQVAAGADHLSVLAKNLARVSSRGWPIVAVLQPALAFFAGEADLTDRLLSEGLASDDPWARAAARMFRANVAENNGDVETMRADIEIALVEFRVLGERWGLANTLGALASLHALEGRLEAADAAYAEALELMRQLKSNEDEAFLLVRRADVALRRGDADRARALMLRARELAEQSGAPMEAVFMMSMLAEIERQTGNVDLARAMNESVLARIAAMRPSHPVMAHGRAVALALAARLRLDADDRADAVPMLQQAYEASEQTRDSPIMALVGVVVAAFAAGGAGTQNAEAAAEVLGAAARLRGADDHTANEIVRLTAELRAALGDDGFETAYQRGKNLDRAAAFKRIDPTEVLTVG